MYLAAALLIFGARLHTVAHCASPLPFWDEWDGIFAHLLLPFTAGTLHPADLFAAHNEHRVVLTRLVDLALFRIQGHWYVLTEMVLTQALFSAGGVWLVRALSTGLAPAARVLLLVPSAVLLAIPFDWQAETWGFCSQLYFCALLTAASLVWIGRRTPDRPGFWLGLGAAALGALCFAGAIAALVAGAVIVGLRDLRGPSPRRGALALALLTAASVALLITTPEAAVNVPYRAKSVHEFLAAATVVFSWPFRRLWLVLAWAPVLAYLAVHARRRGNRDALFWTALGVALWSGSWPPCWATGARPRRWNRATPSSSCSSRC